MNKILHFTKLRSHPFPNKTNTCLVTNVAIRDTKPAMHLKEEGRTRHPCIHRKVATKKDILISYSHRK